MTEQDELTSELLRIATAVMVDTRPHKQGMPVHLDSSIERDLGLDSLGRVELISRVERAFDVSLPEQLLAGAETLRDLHGALLAAGEKRRAATAPAAAREAPTPVEAAPESASTLVEALEWHCRSHPERTHIVYCGESGQEQQISYGALRKEAERIAGGLVRRGLEAGQAVALMLPTGPDYFHCFFGILLAGGIPVPIYPPARLSQIEDHLRRHAGILSNALVRMLITVPDALILARLLKSRVEGLQSVITPGDLASGDNPLQPHRGSPSDTALLQYTSGSTGDPKGVVLTHANLLANIRAMGRPLGVSSTDVFVSWLPLYHDMGLIGAWLGSLFFACPLVVMSPLSFLARPERWLWAIHNHRGTLSAAPNFAFELCLKRIADRDLQGLDLGSWRIACNGAEPVSPVTMTGFIERFAPYGFRPEAIAPVYGLAESSVGLAFPPAGRGLLLDRVRREEFVATGRALPAEEDDREALTFVACGQPLPGHQIRIVDRGGRELPERMEGRLEFKGPSATSGYLRNPEQTRRLFRGEWLDSGDLAYLAGGDVFITGRAKDIIIKAGRNVYPYELEDAVGGIPGIRKGCVAVFGSTDPVSGTERLVVLAETRETAPAALEKLRELINGAGIDLLGFPPDDILLAPPHTVLKTSSGKVRRAASREFYERGAGVRPSPVWLQLSRLALAGAAAQLRRFFSGAAEALYAGYIWALFAAIAPCAWAATVLMPNPTLSWQVSRGAARLFLRCSGISVTAKGIDNLPPEGPVILAANHASYLDGMALVAALPGHFSFVAKEELKGSMISRSYLRKMGSLFVERFDVQKGVEDAGMVQQEVVKGASAIFFPEGTFCRMPGLLPFKMGAFLVAVRSGTPLVPVAICGTRYILHPDNWFPRRGAVVITISPPLREPGADWDAAIRLRDAARAEILRNCGEPDLAERLP